MGQQIHLLKKNMLNRRLVRMGLITLLPVLIVAAFCTARAPKKFKSPIRVVGIVEDEIIEQFLIVTPFATLTPTPTLTPTLVGEAGDNGSGEDGRQDEDEDEDDEGNPRRDLGPRPTQATIVPSVTSIPSATASPIPSATPIPTATASPIPSPSATTPPSPTSTPTSSPPDPPDDDTPTSVPPTSVPPTATTIPTSTSTPTPGPPTISFVASNFSVTEGGANATITVVLSHAYNQTVSVDYSSANGTAFAPNDYGAVGGSLSFAVGQTSQSFSVSIVDDNVDDPDVETVLLTLSNSVNGSLGTANATLNINDNDNLPTIQFSSNLYYVFESSVPTITVTISHPTGKGINFQFIDESPNPGTATAGPDYNSFSLVGSAFTPDITGVSLTSTVVAWNTLLIDDTIPETPITETLFFDLLGPPTNVTFGTPITATLVITDD